MRLQLTDAERLFREEAATCLAENVPGERRPAGGEAMVEFDRRWQLTQFRGGWAGVSWPVEHGGRGLSMYEQMLWYEQRALAGAPGPGIFNIALGHAGPTLILKGDEDQRGAHLERILRGDEPWAQGFSEPDAGSDLASLRSRGRVDGDDLVVSGQKTWSTLAQHCEDYELLVRTDPDSTRPVRAHLEGAAAAAIIDRGTLLAAAALAGCARASAAMAVEYAKVRKQFGRPIGGFQAIAHRCADMAVRGEAAVALALHAALALDDDPERAPELIAAAKAFAGAVAVDNATDAIQVHGAIGFTAEHDGHLYLKRARLLDALWGDRRANLRRLVDAPALQMSTMERI